MTMDLDYGPVYISGGKYKGRIGCFDGEEYDSISKKTKAVVLFGDLLLVNNFHMIDYKYLTPVNTKMLFERQEELTRIIYLNKENGKRITEEDKINYLLEVEYTNSLLHGRMFDAMFSHVGDSIKVFLSHSSFDKAFVMSLAVDLKNYGFDVWLDEWEILAGESIPSKINDGIKECDYLMLILSPNAVLSKWVENEWQAKYWEEVERGHIKLIPVLYQKCEIPPLLKMKKYVDFTKDYTIGLQDVCNSMKKLNKQINAT